MKKVAKLEMGLLEGIVEARPHGGKREILKHLDSPPLFCGSGSGIEPVVMQERCSKARVVQNSKIGRIE